MLMSIFYFIVNPLLLLNLQKSYLPLAVAKMQETNTTRVLHSIFSMEMLIYTRSEELQRNAPLYIGLDPETRKPVKICPENAASLLPCPRNLNDETSYAELEFHLGLLGEYGVLRGPGEVKPHVIKVSQLGKKRTY